MVQHVLYLGSCSMCAGREYVLVDKMFYIWLLCSLDLLSNLSWCFLIETSIWVIYPMLDMKSPIFFILLSTSPFSSDHFCFTYFGVPVLNTYIFSTIMFSWWIQSFSTIIATFLSLVTDFEWKYILSDVSRDILFSFFIICMEYNFSTLSISSYVRS